MIYNYWEKKEGIEQLSAIYASIFFIFSKYVPVYVYCVYDIYIVYMRHVYVCIVYLLTDTKETGNSCKL